MSSARWRSGVRRHGVAAGVGGEHGEVDRAPLDGAAFVEAREGEQVLDQHAHAVGLLLDAAQDGGQVDVGGVGAESEQLGEAADGRQGRAQLVRGVGQEPAQPGLGGLALAKGVLQVVEHPVDGRGELADLGVLVGVGDPGVQVGAGGDGAGGARDRLEGLQPAAQQQPRTESERGEQGQARQQLDGHEPLQALGHLGQGDGHDHRRGVGPERFGQHPPATVVVAAPDGRQPLTTGGRLDLGDARLHAGVGVLADRDDLPRRGAQLGVGAGGHDQGGAVAVPVPLAVVERVVERRGSSAELGLLGQLARRDGHELGQLVVDAVELGPGERAVGPPPIDRQAHREQHGERGDQADAQ